MRYYTFSNYINAETLRKGLSRLDKILSHIPTRTLSPQSTSKIKKGDWLFFTEENSLKYFQNSPEFIFLPKTFPIPIDDKFAFSEFLTHAEELPLPYAPIKNFHPGEIIDFPLCIKPKQSWDNNKKSPRGFICQGPQDFETATLTIKEEYPHYEEVFFIQKYIPIPPESCFSTCGFFDHSNQRRNCILTVQRVLNKNKGLSTGSIVKTIPNPPNLLTRTNAVLNKLKYTGPFELEFLLDKEKKLYFILELNTRFWMQHAIFLEAYDNCLIKRYLNLDSEGDWTEGLEYKPVIWINKIELIKSLTTFNFQNVLTFIKTIRNAFKEKHLIIS